MTLAGFDVKVDPSWLLIAALITWSLWSAYFPSVYPGHTPAMYFTMALIAMLGIFASLILHELAHSIVARQRGVQMQGITLFLFGGVAEMASEPLSPMSEIRIALAGPAMSVALSLGLGIVAAFAPDVGPTLPARQVLSYLAAVNLILAIFNMLPAFPLDGGRVLRAYLWHRTGDVLKATETAARAGTIFAYVLIGLGLFAIFSGYLVGGLWQILIGSFLLVAARTSYQHEFERTYLRGRTVSDIMTRDPVTVSPDMTLSDAVEDVVLRQRISYLPVVEDGVLLGVVDNTVIGKIDRENWTTTRIADVFVDIADVDLLDPEMTVDDLLDTIRRTGRRKFLVTVAHRLIGVVTLADLTRFLGIASLYDQRAPYAR